jgi:hypothetical protein
MGRSVHWLQIGELTAKGHPRHPVRAAYAQGFRPLDMPQYLEQQTTALR